MVADVRKRGSTAAHAALERVCTAERCDTQIVDVMFSSCEKVVMTQGRLYEQAQRERGVRCMACEVPMRCLLLEHFFMFNAHSVRAHKIAV